MQVTVIEPVVSDFTCPYADICITLPYVQPDTFLGDHLAYMPVERQMRAPQVNIKVARLEMQNNAGQREIRIRRQRGSICPRASDQIHG